MPGVGAGPFFVPGRRIGSRLPALRIPSKKPSTPLKFAARGRSRRPSGGRGGAGGRRRRATALDVDVENVIIPRLGQAVTTYTGRNQEEHPR
jgi:hypothetical protein